RRHTRFSRDWSSDVCSSDLQCLSDNCVLFYKWTQSYDLGKQWTVNYNCPDINPNWPIHVTEVSERDENAPTLSEFLGYKPVIFRSEERRVGKECRFWWSPFQ